MAVTSSERIAIDMDEVIADFVSKHLALYDAEFGESLTADDLRGRKLRELVVEERRPRLETYLTADDFFGDLGVVEGSQRVISDLTERYEVFVTTAAMDLPDLLRRQVPVAEGALPVRAGEQHSLLRRQGHHRGRLPHGRQRPPLRALPRRRHPLHRPHNVEENRYRRVNDWQDVREKFL
jgi:5'(3')-deoxyribonucleotidase